MGEKLSVTKIKLLVAALLAALLAVLVFIFFGVQLMKDSKPYDEVRTLCKGVQMLVPAGWEMQKTQAGCYRLSAMFYNKFAFNTLSYRNLEENQTRIDFFAKCGADMAQSIYDKYFSDPDPEKMAQTRIEVINKLYLGMDEELLTPTYRIEYSTINDALAAGERYVIKAWTPKGLMNEFRWYLHLYTPTFGLHLYASCLEKDRPRFEPVFAAIFNSVVLPQNKPCQ